MADRKAEAALERRVLNDIIRTIEDDHHNPRAWLTSASIAYTAELLKCAAGVIAAFCDHLHVEPVYYLSHVKTPSEQDDDG